MVDSRHRRLPLVLFAGLLYTVAGVGTAALAGPGASAQMVTFWRVFAYAISAAVVIAHTAYEHFRLHRTARQTAWDVGLGAALGGLGIALGANIHDLASASGYRPKMLIALVAWPLLTAVPAFIAALVIAYVLGIRRRPA